MWKARSRRPADPADAAPAVPLAGDLAADAIEPAELLDVDVEGLAGAPRLLTADRRRPRSSLARGRRMMLQNPACEKSTQKFSHVSNFEECGAMRTIGLTVLIGLGFVAPAIADGSLPEEYQGVWAAARDCKANFQNARLNEVTRESAICRVAQVTSSGLSETHTSTVYLNCAGSPSREIWHAETIDGADYLVTIQFAGGAGAANTSIDIYKRCPGIPLDEIRLSEIPGNPVAEAGPETKIAPPTRRVQTVRQRSYPHARGARMRKRGPQQK